MVLMVFIQHFYKLLLVRRGNGLVQNLKSRPTLRVLFLVYFELYRHLLKWEMQINLFIEQQWPQVNIIDPWFVFGFEFERILEPPDDLVVLLLLFARHLFKDLQEGFALKVPLFYFFYVLLDFYRFALVWKTLRVLSKKLQLLCLSPLQLLQQLLLQLYACLMVNWLLLCLLYLCLWFGLLLSLILLELFPLLFLLPFSDNKIALYPLLVFSLVFLHKLLLLLLL